MGLMCFSSSCRGVNDVCNIKRPIFAGISCCNLHHMNPSQKTCDRGHIYLNGWEASSSHHDALIFKHNNFQNKTLHCCSFQDDSHFFNLCILFQGDQIYEENVCNVISTKALLGIFYFLKVYGNKMRLLVVFIQS